MSTNYFILVRPSGKPANQKNEDQILTTTVGKLNYILPANNLDYYRTYGLFECGLIDWCRQFGASDKTFLDIGAHSGTYALSLAGVFDRVYAFEPQRKIGRAHV